MGFAEEAGGEDGGGVEEDGHDGDHSGESGDGMDEGGDDFTKAGDDGEKAKDTEDAQRTKNGKGAGSGNEGNGDDEEVEDVPAVCPEAEAVAEEFDEDFGAKNDEAEGVESNEEAPDFSHDCGTGFQAEDDGIDDDQNDDPSLDRLGLDPASEFNSEGGDVFLSKEFGEIGFAHGVFLEG